MRKIIFYVSLLLLIVFVTLFLLRKKDLIVHLNSISPNVTPIEIYWDSELVYEGELKSGVYFGRKVV